MPYPHPFAALPGPARTALNRACVRCGRGPGDSIHLLELPGVKASGVYEAQDLILTGAIFEPETAPDRTNQLDLFTLDY